MANRVSRHWPAPAKINRMLHVVGRRADGYHLLQTVFQFLSQQDMLDFHIRDDGKIGLRNPLEGVQAEDDLLYRAASLLQRYCACGLGVDIGIQKNLPMGGGLGGGSSDAATVLVALNHLWGLELGLDALAELGLELGADVPVFVRGHACWAEGVGEDIQPLDLDTPWFCVIVPPVHVSTAGIFADPDLTRNSAPIKITDFLQDGGRNDCEALVARRYPVIGQALDWLRSRVDEHAECTVKTRMTGTGACLFAGMTSEQSARQVLLELPGDWQGFVAEGMNTSPLMHRLEQEKASMA